jgi:hypothetical protein
MLLQDLRYGLHLAVRNPRFTAVAVLTLGLGIGANTAIFSVVNAVLLRPLPYRDAGRLVVVLESNQGKGYQSFPVSTANFLDWKEQNRVFEEIAAAFDWAFNLTGRGEPEQIRGARVSANFFRMLGVDALRGRTFLLEEDQVGRDNVVVISYGLWKRRFGSDPGVVGQTVSLDGRAYTIIGILPPDFRFATERFELWSPLALSPREIDRAKRLLLVFGRLRPGTTLSLAKQEMGDIARRLEQAYPEADGGWGVYVSFAVLLSHAIPELALRAFCRWAILAVEFRSPFISRMWTWCVNRSNKAHYALIRVDRTSQRRLRLWLHLEGTLFQLGASRPVPNRIDYLAGGRVRRPVA